MTITKTTAEVADILRCSPRKVTETATKHRIGLDLGGRAGFRFTESDIAALMEALRLAAPIVARRPRRRAS